MEKRKPKGGKLLGYIVEFLSQETHLENRNHPCYSQIVNCKKCPVIPELICISLNNSNN